MISVTLLSLLLTGSASIDNTEMFLSSLDCSTFSAMSYILSARPEYWKVRFKRFRQRDYIPPVGSSFYLMPKKQIKKIIDKAAEYGIELE